MAVTVTYHQHELVRGTTHWIAWFCQDDLNQADDDGWVVLKRFGIHAMIVDKHTNRLVPAWER